MTNKKLCPLRRLPGGAFDYCQKERCAWYDPTFEACILKNISDDLDRIAALLKLIWESIDK